MRSFWAVARQTLMECLRTKVVAAFVALLVVCVLAMALTMRGDGSLHGRILTFLSYSVGMAQLLLGLVTIFLATGITSADIRRKSIFSVATKPLPRWQYVLGRWTGLGLVNVLLLALSLGSIYGLSQYLRAGQTAMERKKAAGLAPPNAYDRERAAVDAEVFTARARYHPAALEVEEQVKNRLEALFKDEGQEILVKKRIQRQLEEQKGANQRSEEPVTAAELDKAYRDAGMRELARQAIIADVRSAVQEEKQLVNPGSDREFVFKGISLPAGSNDKIQLQYRPRPLRELESRIIKCNWTVFHPEKRPLFLPQRSDSTESLATLDLPPEAIHNGTLRIFYINSDADAFVPVKLKDEEVSLLVRVGSFEGNLARSGGLILLRLMFLAAAGVLFGVFLSFPVACLACLMVLVTGMLAGFVQEAVDSMVKNDPSLGGTVLDIFSRGVFLFLPDLARTSPVDGLVEGENIALSLLGKELGTGMGPRTLLALGLGCLIFTKRELARVQV